MQISYEHFRGRAVIAADGHTIGEVATLFIDTSAWTVVALQVKLSKVAAEQVGAARAFLHAATVDVPVSMVQSVGDTVLLSVPTVALRQTLPETTAPHEEKT